MTSKNIEGKVVVITPGAVDTELPSSATEPDVAENLDFDRFGVSPEMLALFRGTVTRYGIPDEPVGLIVGLPIGVVTAEAFDSVQRQDREWLQGEHVWHTNGKDCHLEIDDDLPVVTCRVNAWLSSDR